MNDREFAQPSNPKESVSLVIGAGDPCPVFGRMLGHSISILSNTYAHFIPTMQNQAAQLMRNLFTPIQIELKDLENR